MNLLFIGDQKSINVVSKYFSRQSDFELRFLVNCELDNSSSPDLSNIDIVILDIVSRKDNCLNTVQYIGLHYPETKVIARCHYSLESLIIKLNLAGVTSFVGNHDNLAVLESAVRTMFSGGVYLTPIFSEIFRRYLRDSLPFERTPIDLTSQEATLLRGICEGLSSTNLARILHKSPRTVEDYRSILYEKFSVQNKEQLIARAVSMKIV